jgi:predicted nucleotidyltransferase
VLSQHPEVSQVKLIGSRAKACHTAASDIDLALWGVDALQAESIAAELDELPRPYRFDVKSYESIKQDSLREHIHAKVLVGSSLRSTTPKNDFAQTLRLSENPLKLLSQSHSEHREIC